MSDYQSESCQKTFQILLNFICIFQAVQFWNEVSERLQTVLDKSVGLTLEIQNKLEDGFISPLSREVVRGLRKEVNDLVLDHVDDGGCEDEVEGEEDHIG